MLMPGWAPGVVVERKEKGKIMQGGIGGGRGGERGVEGCKGGRQDGGRESHGISIGSIAACGKHGQDAVGPGMRANKGCSAVKAQLEHG